MVSIFYSLFPDGTLLLENGQLFMGSETPPAGDDIILVECDGQVMAKWVVSGNDVHLWIAGVLRVYEDPAPNPGDCDSFTIDDSQTAATLLYIDEEGNLTLGGGLMIRGTYENERAVNYVPMVAVPPDFIEE